MVRYQSPARYLASRSASRAAAGRRASPFAPVVESTGLFVMTLAALGLALWLIGARHEARAEAHAVCAREVQMEVKRRPHLDNVVRLADPCLTLARMRGER